MKSESLIRNPQSAIGNAPDPEAELQERGDWFTDLVMLVFTYAPLLPLLVYCAAVVLTTVGIIIHHFTR
jgi:hypothetical protein